MVAKHTQESMLVGQLERKKENTDSFLSSKLSGRGRELVKETNRIETPYEDKAFFRDLSLMAKNLISAGIISAVIGIAVISVNEKSVEAPALTEQQIYATFKDSVDLNRVSVLDLLNNRDRLLPYGENTVEPRNEVINSTVGKDKMQAAAHLDSLQEVLSLTRAFDNYAQRRDIDVSDPIARVLATMAFDNDRVERLENAGVKFEGHLRPEQTEALFSRLEQMGNYERYDREAISYKSTYDEQFAPNP